MNIKKLVLSTAVCLAFAGCEKIADWLPTGKEKRAIEKAVDEASRPEADVVAAPQASADLQAFRHHVETAAKMLDGELAAASKRVDEIRADSDALAKAMSAVAVRKSEDGGSIGKKEALLALLRDDAVNALARRYLQRNFSMVALEVEERVSEAEGAERRRRSELDANAEAAKAAIASAHDEDRRARTSLMESKQKLKHEIESLRRRKAKLENELNMIAASDRPRRRQEIRELDGEIRRMEREYGGLRESSVVNSEVQRSEERVRQARVAADVRRSRSDDDILRRGKSTSPIDVGAAFERDTLTALEKAIADALSAAEARKTRIIRAANYVKTAGDVRRSLAPSALNSLRAEIDAKVSAAMDEAK